MFNGQIQMKPNTIDEVHQICKKIRNKDSDFNFTIDGFSLIIHHPDRNKCYKKIIWLINKVKPLEGCKFKVKKIK